MEEVWGPGTLGVTGETLLVCGKTRPLLALTTLRLDTGSSSISNQDVILRSGLLVLICEFCRARPVPSGKPRELSERPSFEDFSTGGY